MPPSRHSAAGAVNRFALRAACLAPAGRTNHEARPNPVGIRFVVLRSAIERPKRGGRSDMARSIIRKRFRATVASLAIAGGLVVVSAGPASAHVHGITPLRCVGVANDGANQTDATPASAANGGPISGLIPRDVGQAALTIGDGGFDTPACPAG